MHDRADGPAPSCALSHGYNVVQTVGTGLDRLARAIPGLTNGMHTLPLGDIDETT